MALLSGLPPTSASLTVAPSYRGPCTGPSPSVNTFTSTGNGAASGLSVTLSGGNMAWTSQSAAGTGPAGSSIWTGEQLAVDPSPSGCYDPSVSASSVTADFTFSFSGTMTASIGGCPNAGVANVSLLLLANVYSSSAGALFTTPPSVMPVNQLIRCPTTLFTATPIANQVVSVGPFSVTHGVSYSFFAEVEIFNGALPATGFSASSSESSFVVTLSSVVCGACP